MPSVKFQAKVLEPVSNRLELPAKRLTRKQDPSPPKGLSLELLTNHLKLQAQVPEMVSNRFELPATCLTRKRNPRKRIVRLLLESNPLGETISSTLLEICKCDA